MIRNHYGIPVDSEKPTTGVFQNNRCEWLWEDIDEGGISLSYYCWLEYEGRQDDDEALEEYGMGVMGVEDWLIGFVETTEEEEAWYWFDHIGKGFKPEPKAEYSAIVGEIYTQVVRSKWVIRCALCSPCYPGQGDPDTPGEFLAYTLPPDVIGDADPEVRERIFRKEE